GAPLSTTRTDPPPFCRTASAALRRRFSNARASSTRSPWMTAPVPSSTRNATSGLCSASCRACSPISTRRSTASALSSTGREQAEERVRVVAKWHGGKPGGGGGVVELAAGEGVVVGNGALRRGGESRQRDGAGERAPGQRRVEVDVEDLAAGAIDVDDAPLRV